MISKARKAADEEIQTAIEALPGLDLKSFDLNKYGNLDTAIDFDGSFAASLGTPKGSADNLKKLAQEVDAKSTVIANILNAKAGKQKVSILAPAGIKIDSWTYDGNEIKDDIYLFIIGKF